MPTASSLRPLWDRAAEWECRLRMIREATSFLYLSTFYIEYDRYGIELLAALLDAQRRGVAVNLLVDGFGQLLGGVLMTSESRRALAACLDALRDAGAVVTTYRPEHYLQRRLGGGQHVKIQVSEMGEAIFGSSNVTRSSFEGWNEYSVSLHGPVVHTLLASYRDIGGQVDDDHLSSLGDVARTGSMHTTPIDLEYWLCNPNLLQGRLGPVGWRGQNVVTDQLITMVQEARETIELTSFFFKPTAPLMAALLDVARRGVRVDVYHSHRDALPATDLAWIASAVTYERLMDAGITVYENRRGEHSKLVLVDRARVAFGSYNFEDAAHDRLAEAMLVSRDARAIDPAASIFDGLRRDPDNMRVTDERMRALPRRVKRRLALYGRFKRWM
jgi:cardiolipin synthase